MSRPGTRDRLLRAARRQLLVGEPEAVSARAITAAAEVNLAAINYHFGSKDRLLREVLREAARGLSEAWGRELVDPSASVGAVATAFITPVVADPDRLALVARALVAAPSALRNLAADELAVGLELLTGALQRVCPDASRSDLHHELTQALAIALLSVPNSELVGRLGGGRYRSEGVEAAGRRIEAALVERLGAL